MKLATIILLLSTTFAFVNAANPPEKGTNSVAARRDSNGRAAQRRRRSEVDAEAANGLSRRAPKRGGGRNKGPAGAKSNTAENKAADTTAKSTAPATGTANHAAAPPGTAAKPNTENKPPGTTANPTAGQGNSPNGQPASQNPASNSPNASKKEPKRDANGLSTTSGAAKRRKQKEKERQAKIDAAYGPTGAGANPTAAGKENQHPGTAATAAGQGNPPNGQPPKKSTGAQLFDKANKFAGTDLGKQFIDSSIHATVNRIGGNGGSGRYFEGSQEPGGMMEERSIIFARDLD